MMPDPHDGRGRRAHPDTLCHPDDGDLAAVLGIGFPRRLGGPFHWADRVRPAELLLRLERLDGAAFPPGATLVRLASDSGQFADERRRPRPGRGRT